MFHTAHDRAFFAPIDNLERTSHHREAIAGYQPYDEEYQQKGE